MEYVGFRLSLLGIVIMVLATYLLFWSLDPRGLKHEERTKRIEWAPVVAACKPSSTSTRSPDSKANQLCSFKVDQGCGSSTMRPYSTIAQPKGTIESYMAYFGLQVCVTMVLLGPKYVFHTSTWTHNTASFVLFTVACIACGIP